MITTGFLIGIGLVLAMIALYAGVVILYILVHIVAAIVEALSEVFKKEWNDKREWF